MSGWKQLAWHTISKYVEKGILLDNITNIFILFPFDFKSIMKIFKNTLKGLSVTIQQPKRIQWAI